MDRQAPAPRLDGGRRFARGARHLGLQATVWLCRVPADALAIVAAFALAYWLHQLLLHVGTAFVQPSVSWNGHNYAALAALFSVIALLVFWERGLYRPRASVLNLWELKTSLESVALAAAIFFAMLFALRLEDFSRLVVTSAIALSMFSVVLERRLLAGVLRRLQFQGRLGRRVLIYGCDPTGQLLMKKLVQAPHVACTVVGFIDDVATLGSRVFCRIAQTGRFRFEAEVLGRWTDVEAVVSTYQVEEILVVGSSATSERMREIFQFCRDRGVTVGIVPHVEDIRADQLALDDLDAIPVLRPQTQVARRPFLVVKRLVDVVGSLLLLLVTAPIWLLAMILVRVGSPGPLLFVQERVGIGSRRFSMLKFRTMTRDANPYATSPAGDVDARVTPVGRILRATGVDELPQLLNVLRGEMSLVGPRPEMPFIVDGYSALQRKRLEVRPGLTGLWQLSADRHAEIHENIEYDLYYITHQSLVLDALILLETVFFTAGQVLKVFRRKAKEDGRPADVTGQLVRSAEPYVLLALDQRLGSTTPESWRSLVPTMYQIADRYRIKMLVARDNVQTYDALIADALRRYGTPRQQPELIVYGTRAELRSLVRGATAVITDLPHAARWSAEVGCRTVMVRDGTLGQRCADLALDPLEEAIRASLTTRDPLAGQPKSSRDRLPLLHPSDVSWSSLDTPPPAHPPEH